MLIDLFRFLNLLEPKRKIISISKVWMWLTMILSAWVLTTDPSNFEAVISTVTAQTIATGNYGYRRYMQYRTRTGSFDTGTDDYDPRNSSSI